MIFPIFHIPSKFEAETSVSASTLFIETGDIVNNTKDTLGIYIHIPFCDGKCNYCDFYSFKSTEPEIDRYCDILVAQIKAWALKLKGRLVDTVYFGGGTPSLMGTERLVVLLNAINNAFQIASDCEITLEVNPSSGKEIDFSVLKNSGFNRVSLGMQSSSDEELRLLGRRHRNSDVVNTVDSIKSAGIENFSLDVMLGIPLQTKDSLKDTLDFCLSLGAKHISTYMLSIEENTVFGRSRDRFDFASDDTQAEFFEYTSEYLNSKGFKHYEISNFCKDNFFSRHNMRYWQLKDYLGLGPSAHSLIDGKRFYFPSDMQAFENNKYIEDGIGKTAEEYIMLSLRTSDGLKIKEYESQFGKKLANDFYKKVDLFKNAGYIEYDDNGIRLSEKGFLLSNTIIANLI